MLNLRLAERESMDRAIALLEQAIELDPEYVEALVELAGALELKGSFRRSPTLFRRASSSSSARSRFGRTDAAAHVQRGDTLLAMGRAEEAIAALQEGVRLQPDRAAAHGSLARAYWLGKGRVDEAITSFERALQLNPEAGYTHLQLALLYTLRGDYEAAENIAKEAIRLQDQAMSGTTGLLVVGAHTRLGYVLLPPGSLRRGDSRISARAGVAVGRRSSAARAHEHRAAAEARRGVSAQGDSAAAERHESAAIRLFDARLAAGGDDPCTRYYMAALYGLRGDAEAAQRHLELPLKELPRSPAGASRAIPISIRFGPHLSLGA